MSDIHIPPVDEKIQVVDYDFQFTNGRGAIVTVWPSLGDSCDYNREERQWEFKFPRLNNSKIIHREHVNVADRTEATRIYVDPNKAMRDVIEGRKRVERERETRKTVGDGF